MQVHTVLLRRELRHAPLGPQVDVNLVFGSAGVSTKPRNSGKSERTDSVFHTHSESVEIWHFHYIRRQVLESLVTM